MSVIPIYDHRGKVIGYKDDKNGTYMNAGGKVEARVINGSTYNGQNGKFEGKGDQGMRFLGR